MKNFDSIKVKYLVSISVTGEVLHFISKEKALEYVEKFNAVKMELTHEHSVATYSGIMLLD